MRIDASGNVGIANSSPADALDVEAGGSTGGINDVARFATPAGGAATSRILFGSFANPVCAAIGAQTTTATSGDLTFYTEAGGSLNENMRITASGNVGIGTSTIGYRLVVGGGSGSTTAPTAISMDDTYASSPAWDRLKFYLFKNSTESYGLGLGVSADMQYWAGPTNDGMHTFFTRQTERMRLDNSGNLLVGLTSASGLPSGGGSLIANGVVGAKNPLFDHQTATGILEYFSNVTRIRSYGATASTGIIAFNTGGGGGSADTERMRIDSTGYISLGSGAALGDSLEVIPGGISGTPVRRGIKLGADPDGTFDFYINSNQNNAVFRWFNGNGAAELMRLNASGDLLVGTTSGSTSSSPGVKVLPAEGGANSPQLSIVTSASTATTASLAIYSSGASALRFYVDNGGTIYATNTSISAISDQRLKENVRDLDAGLDTILALKPRRFDWKMGKGKDVKDDMGFIAQEVETVLPELVGGWKAGEGEPDDLKSVKAGDLIPVLVKAIQELTARVAQLEGN
jgi:hypothetical protein